MGDNVLHKLAPIFPIFSQTLFFLLSTRFSRLTPSQITHGSPPIPYPCLTHIFVHKTTRYVETKGTCYGWSSWGRGEGKKTRPLKQYMWTRWQRIAKAIQWVLVLFYIHSPSQTFLSIPKYSKEGRRIFYTPYPHGFWVHCLKKGHDKWKIYLKSPFIFLYSTVYLPISFDTKIIFESSCHQVKLNFKEDIMLGFSILLAHCQDSWGMCISD